MLAYSVSADSELQFWASALLLNMAMTSDDVKKEIIMLGGLKPLMELAIGDSDHPQCSTHAAKTLVMLGFLGELLTNILIPGSLVSFAAVKRVIMQCFPPCNKTLTNWWGEVLNDDPNIGCERDY